MFYTNLMLSSHRIHHLDKVTIVVQFGDIFAFDLPYCSGIIHPSFQVY